MKNQAMGINKAIIQTKIQRFQLNITETIRPKASVSPSHSRQQELTLDK
jgi:hypothetical protein